MKGVLKGVHLHKQVIFDKLDIGETFHKDFFKNGYTRFNVLCIKKGDKSFMEVETKTVHEVCSSVFNVIKFR